jgi:hypothetical protein
VGEPDRVTAKTKKSDFTAISVTLPQHLSLKIQMHTHDTELIPRPSEAEAIGESLGEFVVPAEVAALVSAEFSAPVPGSRPGA